MKINCGPYIDDLNFKECAACKAKPGSPVLCASCQDNRAVINFLRNKINLQKELKNRPINCICESIVVREFDCPLHGR